MEDNKNGVIFTPEKTVKTIWNLINEYTNYTNSINILDNSAGVGNLIKYAHYKNKDIFTSSKWTCFEINKEFIHYLEELQNKYLLNINNSCFLAQRETFNNYDLIISNPPYNRISKIGIVNNSSILKGDISAYPLFIEHSIRSLKEGGVLAIICPCMWTRQYFTYPLVKFVNAQTDILYISEPSEDYFENADVLCSIYLFRKIKNV